jgi:epoxyqueuosine reductase
MVIEAISDNSAVDPIFASLAAQGLNLSAVFSLESLPPEVLVTLALTDDERKRFRQLILIGHRGRDFWTALQLRGMHGAHPMDQFVTERVAAWMEGPLQGHEWRQVFPGPQPVGLQRLGALAGWHHPSPFWVGVDAEWGSWFAYRAVVLADTHLALTPRRETHSPCETCRDKPCISACPAGALASEQTGAWRLQTCLDFRKQPDSPCQDRCLARNACPVGEGYRYADTQVAYHYLHSMRAIREHY